MAECPAEFAAADAIPRDYNFADDLFRPFRRQAAGSKGRLYRSARDLDLRPARRARRAIRRVLRRRHPARGAHADVPARHDRLADRLPRHDPSRARRGAGQHADDRGRLPLHAGRQPGARMLVVSQALYPKFEKLDRPRLPTSTWSSSRAADRELPIADLEDLIAAAKRGPCTAPTTCDDIASGSTPRARPASRRGRCISMPTCG